MRGSTVISYPIEHRGTSARSPRGCGLSPTSPTGVSTFSHVLTLRTDLKVRLCNLYIDESLKKVNYINGSRSFHPSRNLSSEAHFLRS